MKRVAVLLLLLGCDAIPGIGPDAGQVRATVTRPPADTLMFAIPATARRCAGGRGEILLEAANGRGFGLMAVLRGLEGGGADSLPLLAPRDTVTPRGAQAAARFVVGDAVHGLALDSGTVFVTGGLPQRLEGRIRGKGYEASVRVTLAAEFWDVPLAAGDTGSCNPQ
ncbi:MAG: hypothetical protein ACREMN_07860 [Gemmatimonadales bacterium]